MSEEEAPQPSAQDYLNHHRAKREYERRKKQRGLMLLVLWTLFMPPTIWLLADLMAGDATFSKGWPPFFMSLMGFLLWRMSSAHRYEIGYEDGFADGQGVIINGIRLTKEEDDG